MQLYKHTCNENQFHLILQCKCAEICIQIDSWSGGCPPSPTAGRGDLNAKKTSTVSFTLSQTRVVEGDNEQRFSRSGLAGKGWGWTIPQSKENKTKMLTVWGLSPSNLLK